MWHQGISYIKFLIRSKNQHGVHSPFVYDLVTKCLYDRTHHQAYNLLDEYRAKLRAINQIIEIIDLGAGSKRMRNTRKIASIVKHNSSTLKRTKLLYRIVRYLKANTILELGTSLGIGTQAISLGNPNANVTSVEGCSNISSFTKTQLNSFNNNNITLINSEFSDYLKNLIKRPNSFDLIFIDGNHKKETTLEYFETLLGHIHNDSVMIFDDIYWSKGMTEAWEQIKQHPKVTVTIDTFNWGFIFFRKEQVKEHFKIRL